MPTVVANNNNNNTSSTKTHTDYSLTEDMKKAVSLWDKIIVAHKRGKLTKVRWPDCDGVLLSEEEWIDKVMSKKTYSLCKLTFVESIGNVYKIEYTSFCRYATDNKRERTRQDTKLGRPPKSRATLELEADVLNTDAVSDFYEYIGRRGNIPVALQIIEDERMQQNISIERLRHSRRMMAYSQTHRTDDEKRWWRRYWKVEIVRLCKTFRYGDCYLKKEKELMRICEETNNSLDDVYYVGPDAYETKEETKYRRDLIEMRLQNCQLIHTRRCLNVAGKSVLVLCYHSINLG